THTKINPSFERNTTADVLCEMTQVFLILTANHRNIVRMPVVMRELWLEMWHDMHPHSKSKFVTKAFRGPLRHEDCHWDYAKARCAFPEFCEYRSF
uniref:Uncharacterized protein n=1 Tax=Aegilops tauschii subsp. strangulata TaxID=200361 RepID=A0A453PJ10_AEGTS